MPKPKPKKAAKKTAAPKASKPPKIQKGPPPAPTLVTHCQDETGTPLHVAVAAPNGFDRSFEIRVIRNIPPELELVETFPNLSTHEDSKRYAPAVLAAKGGRFQIDADGAIQFDGKALPLPPIPLHPRTVHVTSTEPATTPTGSEPSAPRKRATASAKRSKKAAEENPHQFYQTPAWAVDVLVPYLDLPKENAVIADLGAGHGALTRALLKHTDEATARTINIEIQDFGKHFADRDPERHTFHRMDMLAESARVRELIAGAHVVISNPAFKLGELIARIALGEGMRPSADMAFLLPIDFLCAKERRGFHQRFVSDMYPFSERIKFSGASSSGMANYAWFVFGPRASGRFLVL